MGLVLLFESFQRSPIDQSKRDTISQEANKTNQNLKIRKKKQSARIMAHGDLLYHDIIYMSAKRKMAAMIFMRILNT